MIYVGDSATAILVLKIERGVSSLLLLTCQIVIESRSTSRLYGLLGCQSLMFEDLPSLFGQILYRLQDGARGVLGVRDRVIGRAV